jgi:hypothetical protein
MFFSASDVSISTNKPHLKQSRVDPSIIYCFLILEMSTKRPFLSRARWVFDLD